eukprot:4650159-Pleurochrysis_carterae.AAC.1
MPLRRRLGRIGGAFAGEPRGGAHRRRWRERMKETTGGSRPDVCDRADVATREETTGGRRPDASERAGVAARVGDGESRQIVG